MTEKIIHVLKAKENLLREEKILLSKEKTLLRKKQNILLRKCFPGDASLSFDGMLNLTLLTGRLLLIYSTAVFSIHVLDVLAAPDFAVFAVKIPWQPNGRLKLCQCAWVLS